MKELIEHTIFTKVGVTSIFAEGCILSDSKTHLGFFRDGKNHLVAEFPFQDILEIHWKDQKVVYEKHKQEQIK